MDESKRLLVSMVLIAGFLYIWFEFVAPKPQRNTPQPTPSVAPTLATQIKPTESKVGQVEKKSERKLSASYFSSESDVFKLEWSNVGGTLHSLLLNKYRTTLNKTSPFVEMVPFMGPSNPPLLWNISVDGVSYEDANADYQVVSQTPNEIIFQRKLNDSTTVRKSFRWEKNSYLLDHAIEFVNSSGQTKKITARAELSAGTALVQNPSMMNRGDPLHVTAFINEQVSHPTIQNLQKNPTLPTGDTTWAGFDSHYFLLNMVPTEGRWVELHPSLTTEEAKVKEVKLQAVYPNRDVNPNETAVYRLKLYAGPKDITILKAAGSNLDRAIDLGNWLGPIARPILYFLRWIHRVIPNYGIAIILLTVIVRLLMFPLSQRQAQSMKKMQQHKPEMDALKEKHGDNKEAYSRELMSYMRTHKINPMGGCLLLLPQLPVFFALYRVLYNSIELRQAPFFGWIHDLSAHDPLFILPVLLGIVMFIQQKITPTPGVDPAQQSAMKIMPVMFTFFMLFLPAGLTLYIFVSTLWGIGQQAWVQKGLSPKAITN